jgi:two-component system invasion response regulator UvrY
MYECVRILIVEEQGLLRESLRHLLGGQGFAVMGVPSVPSEAVRLLAETSPDVILLGTGASAERALPALRQLIEVAPAARVLFRGEARMSIPDILMAGGRGLVGERATPEELYRAVRAVVGGQLWFDRHVLSEAILGLKKQLEDGLTRMRDADGLSPRDRRIAVAVSRGHSNREIASTLGLSKTAVKDQLAALFSRLDLANRAELSAWATRRGLDDGL